MNSFSAVFVYSFVVLAPESFCFFALLSVVAPRKIWIFIDPRSASPARAPRLTTVWALMPLTYVWASIVSVLLGRSASEVLI